MIKSEIPAFDELIAGRYRLRKLLGQGGMGLVYQADDIIGGDGGDGGAREVALKVLLPEVAARPDAAKRFEREAKVAAAFQHPNAVRIFDFGADQGRLYIAMERLRGETLHDRLQQTAPLAIAEAVRLGLQIADVLAAAHDAGLVHRDIKPANFFLDDSGPSERVVMLDFGLAFLQNPGTNPGDSVLGRFTKEGHAGGTPLYMSPEQACGADPGPPSDVYAFGCVFYELLIGRPPFTSTGIGRLLSEHLYAVPPELRALRSQIPASLADLTRRMLQKRPSERPNPLDIQAQLNDILDSFTGATGRADEAAIAPSRSRTDRMIATPAPAPDDTQPDVDAVRVALVGHLAEEVVVGLQVNGIDVKPGADPAALDSADVIFAGGLSSADLKALITPERIVIADASALDEVNELIKLGVNMVVLRPIQVDNMATKIRRALRKRRRRR
ncbi:MAG: hypothetical protein Tsb0020_31390 [Haliangiales bacterium]